MLESPLAPYLLWAKKRRPAALDLAGSNLLPCTLDDLPGARDAIDLWVANDDGYAPLVGAIAGHYRVAADRVVTAPGCSGANFIVIAALLGPGDDVLIERPTYDPLIGASRLIGATVRRFDRRFEDRYALDLGSIRAAMTSRTRLIIVTTPHNPTGVMIEELPLRELGQIAAECGAHVLVDEVYLDGATFVRSGSPMPSAARLDGPFIATSSLTKSYGLAGLRCGWAIAPPAIAERLLRTRDLVDNISAAPADLLSALAFAQLGHLADRARALLTGNIGRARQFFADHPRLQLAAPPAASVCFPRLAGVENAGPFADRLLDRYGVAVAPGRFFDAPGHFRLSLAGRSEALEAGLAKIGEALREYGT